MGFSFNGLSGAAVTISGGVGSEPSAITGTGKTVVNKCVAWSGSVNTPQDLYTPTVGTVLYITSMTIFHAAAGSYRVGDNISGNAFAAGTRDNEITAGVSGQGATVHTFPAPLKVVTKLVGIPGANTSMSVSFTGWEQ